MSSLLEGFIKRFVQCGQCKNPETDILVTKKGGQKDVVMECNACGAKTPVDMRHKLTTYIMNNPPETSKRKETMQMKSGEPDGLEQGPEISDEESKEKEKRERKKERREKKKERESETEGADGKEKKKKKDKKAKGEKSRSKAKSEKRSGGEDVPANTGDGSDDADDTEFQTDTSKKAQEQRMSQLSSAAAAMTASAGSGKERRSSKTETNGSDESDEDDNEVEEEEEPEEQEVVQLREAAANEGANGTLEALANMCIERPESEAHVLVEGLLGGSSSLPARAKTVRNHFTMYAQEDEEKQVQILCALEYFLTDTAPAQQHELPLVLKLLYDSDAIDDNAIHRWYNNVCCANAHGVAKSDALAVRKAASKFVEWLREAEEESDEDDGEVEN